MRHGVQDHGLNAGSGSPRSPSEGALKTERPSHEHRDPVAEAATQDNNVRQNRSKARRRYEWPLIINGVYQVRTLSLSHKTYRGSKRVPLLLRYVSPLRSLV